MSRIRKDTDPGIAEVGDTRERMDGLKGGFDEKNRIFLSVVSQFAVYFILPIKRKN
jgi:hypothetical protein